MAMDAFSIFLKFRPDEICLVLVTIGGCFLTRRDFSHHAPTETLSLSTIMGVIAIAFVGIGIAELATLSMLDGSSSSLAWAAISRFGAISFAATATGFVLVNSARSAALRAVEARRSVLEEELQQTRSIADKANRAKNDFLGVMSHEIRTPLNAVLGFATLLGESALDSAQRSYVTTIKSEGVRLDAMLNDILDLTKIEEGALKLDAIPFAPAEIVRDVVAALNSRAAAKSLDLRMESQIAGPLLVPGDSARFRQVIFNLVENAIKFTPRGSVTVFLGWHPPCASDAQGQLSVRVRDTGIGIPPDKIKDLFTMFMQADASATRRYGGVGLGLAVCQRLVALMGGQILVQSAVGQGSEFSFSLPLTALPATAKAPALSPIGNPKSLYAPRILVVDDMETNRFLLEIFLRRNGFEPELAAGGEEAIRLATTVDYDAILMDLQMPDVDGYAATQRIRAAEPSDRHTPIIALTASSGQGTREKCLAAGMDEHLTKPLDLNKFKQILDAFIGQAASSPS
jgi:signal transduction histidine kinase/ActR/RegA family two-component response regulator